MHCKAKYIPKHPIIQQNILQPPCSPSEKLMYYVSKYTSFSQYNNSNLKVVIWWIGYFSKNKGQITAWNPPFLCLTQVLSRSKDCFHHSCFFFSSGPQVLYHFNNSNDGDIICIFLFNIRYTSVSINTFIFTLKYRYHSKLYVAWQLPSVFQGITKTF